MGFKRRNYVYAARNPKGACWDDFIFFYRSHPKITYMIGEKTYCREEFFQYTHAGSSIDPKLKYGECKRVYWDSENKEWKTDE